MYQLYLVMTPLSILLIILAILFQNIFPKFFGDSGGDKSKKKIEISVQPEETRKVKLMILGVIIILFVPVVNFIFAMVLSTNTMSNYFKNRNKV